jgi:prepilin-type N-terminal cleavage/methylation domain-containing protein
MRKKDERRGTRDEGGGGMAGFTLIETIITLVVLSIAAVGVLSVFTVGIKGSANPLVVEQAVQLAQEKMDMIIGDRENPAGGFGFVYIKPGSYPAEAAGSFGFAGFSRTTTIICVDPGALNTDNTFAPPCASGYTHVTVTVANALIGSVSVETIVTNY